MRALILPTAALVVGLVVTTTSACLWDTDTLAMERQKFPEALELITGQFLRHSPEFYRWRVEDRQKRIATEPDRIELYDDLAVAYDKLGEHEKAIETILAKEKLKPGLYETYANLGTFYIHNGQLEEGLKHIDKAIEINPDAHFGREKYQRMLVEYVLTKRSRGVAGLPLADSSTGDFVNYVDFAGFIWSKRREKKDSSTETDYDPQAAIKGVLGMMKFGKHDSPILLEALGDLLSGSSEHAPKQLAARAYLKASYEVDDPKAKAKYREKAGNALEGQVKAGSRSHDRSREDYMSLEDLEEWFNEQLTAAKGWYGEVHQNELDWISAELNPEEEFAKKYYDEPVAQAATTPAPPKSQGFPTYAIVVAGLSAILLCVAVMLALSRGRPAATT